MNGALDAIVLLHRGTCTFIEKLAYAKRAGARGVVVISDMDMAINPSAEAEELEQLSCSPVSGAAPLIGNPDEVPPDYGNPSTAKGSGKRERENTPDRVAKRSRIEPPS